MPTARPKQGTSRGNAGKGRQPGSQNKVTRAFKEAVLLAFHGIGGDKTFQKWATDNQTEFYKIAARLIPTEMQHSGTVTVVPEVHDHFTAAGA